MYETYIEVKASNQNQVAADPLLAMTDDKDPSGKKTKPIAQKVENEILVTSDHECMILALIIRGLKGQQHSVRMFNPTKEEPIVIANRAGNTDLEFNMNSHIRVFNQIFIVQTDSSGAVTAKQLEFDPEEKEDEKLKFPTITFTRPERGYAKDCWVVTDHPEDLKQKFVVFTLCKSSTDEGLNSDCIIPTLKEASDDYPAYFKLEKNFSQVKAQEIDLNYPCLVSNIGLSRVMIQSLTNPTQVATFRLDDREMEFICFADYQSMADIGFVDKRDELT